MSASLVAWVVSAIKECLDMLVRCTPVLPSLRCSPLSTMSEELITNGVIPAGSTNLGVAGREQVGEAAAIRGDALQFEVTRTRTRECVLLFVSPTSMGCPLESTESWLYVSLLGLCCPGADANGLTSKFLSWSDMKSFIWGGWIEGWLLFQASIYSKTS